MPRFMRACGIAVQKTHELSAPACCPAPGTKKPRACGTSPAAIVRSHEIVPKLDLPRCISEKRSIAWSRQTVTQATT